MIKISLVKPILNSILPFSASQDYTINFSAPTGDQVYANEINIFRNDTNALVYNNKTVVPYFQLNHIIPANTLVNTSSYNYKIQLRTYNNNGEYSVWSDWLLFSCFSDPNIDITNITNNGTINNQTWNFQGSYSQAEGNVLQSYKYILYNANNIEIGNSGTIFNTLLEYQFTGFENNTSYYIELQVTTQYNVTKSIKKFFTANYILPVFNNLITLTNNPAKACIDVEIKAMRILGYSTGTVTIENNDVANLLNGTVTFDNEHGFKLPSGDWTLQLWCSNLVDNKVLMNGVLEGDLVVKLYAENNILFKIEYFDGRFHLYKFIGDFLFADYTSNIINAAPENNVYLYCQSINGRINLECEILS